MEPTVESIIESIPHVSLQTLENVVAKVREQAFRAQAIINDAQRIVEAATAEILKRASSVR